MKKLLPLFILIFAINLSAQIKTSLKPGADRASASTAIEESLLSLPPGLTTSDTTTADFQTGTATNVDLTSSPDNLLLAKPSVIDQQQTVASNSGPGLNTTQWTGQTFVPGVTGNLTRIEMLLFCVSCSGTSQPITVEIRTTDSASGSALPTDNVLATTTIAGFSSDVPNTYAASFATPPALTAGTTYAYTLRLMTNQTGTYAAVFGTAPTDYPNGNRVVSSNSGGTWTVPTNVSVANDLVFRTFMETGGYAATGDFISGLKDTHPAPGESVSWETLSWTGTTPANTSLAFQIAASNSATGPFNFVGPDGTAASFYTTSGVNLNGLFSNNRYLKYKAYFSTTDAAQTPVLGDVTIGYSTLGPTAAAVSVSGRITTASGRGIRNVLITMTDSQGSERTAASTTFGYYRFDNVAAGETVTLSVKARQFRFDQPAIVRTTNESIADADFVSEQ